MKRKYFFTDDSRSTKQFARGVSDFFVGIESEYAFYSVTPIFTYVHTTSNLENVVVRKRNNISSQTTPDPQNSSREAYPTMRTFLYQFQTKSTYVQSLQMHTQPPTLILCLKQRETMKFNRRKRHRSENRRD